MLNKVQRLSLGLSMHSNHSELSDITTGKLSVKSSSLHTIPTKPCHFDRVRKKLTSHS